MDAMLIYRGGGTVFVKDGLGETDLDLRELLTDLSEVSVSDKRTKKRDAVPDSIKFEFQLSYAEDEEVDPNFSGFGAAASTLEELVSKMAEQFFHWAAQFNTGDFEVFAGQPWYVKDERVVIDTARISLEAVDGKKNTYSILLIDYSCHPF